eukprot:GFKZ01003343.1.p2 GENE.GFKZ01003343.1~~GFKZ01003343.1.p2  ORF type:complete len:321 (+),score=54.50 GFKZ01003343.1:251-1213(+)
MDTPVSFIFNPLPRTNPRQKFHPLVASLSSLRDARIAITAPTPYASRLAPLLIQKEARPVWMPMITTTSLSSATDIANLEAELMTMPSFDVLAFTSRTAMTAVGERLLSLADGNLELSASMLRASGIKIAALGRDATAAMKTLGVTVDIIPVESSPLGLVRHLSDYEQMEGSKILCPIPKFIGMREPPVVPDFLKEFAAQGFDVTAVAAYETKPVSWGSVETEISMLLDGRVDAVAISSSGEAHAMREVFGGGNMDEFKSKVESNDIIVGAHGPFTAAGVRQALGIDPVVSEDYSSFDGLVTVLEERFTKRAVDGLLLPR